MILSKQDYIEYLEADYCANNVAAQKTFLGEVNRSISI